MEIPDRGPNHGWTVERSSFQLQGRGQGILDYRVLGRTAPKIELIGKPSAFWKGETEVMNARKVRSNCDENAAVVRGQTYEFKESGLPVILKGIDVIRCDHCGNEDPIIPHTTELMRVAIAVITKPYRLRGEDLRFLRKYIRLTQEEFSRLLNVNKSTLSKWETNDDRIGEQGDRLIRLITLVLAKSLRSDMERTIREFANIKDRKVGITMNAETLEYEYAA